MVELVHNERTIRVKIVYYGPPVGGKTTNLQVLHQHAKAQQRGELISINSAQDRTILFDLLPLKAPGFRGYELRIQTIAVPGQAMYAATRRLMLKNADACVFVANSAADRWEENLQSFREMTQNLLAHGLDPASLPLVIQFNKRDLPEVTPIDFMEHALNARKTDALPAVAVRGEGVLETFQAILIRAMQDLSTRYRIIHARQGQTLTQWTESAVLGMFGATSLATEPNPIEVAGPAEPATSSGSDPVAGTREAPPSSATPAPLSAYLTPPPPPEPAPERRRVKVALPAEAEKMAGLGPDARANETLVESYAQASSQLSMALAEAKEERDLLRRRAEDLQQVLSAGQGLLAGQPLDPVLRGVLARLAAGVEASHASFLVVQLDKSLRAAALRGLSEDPLFRSQHGQRYLNARLFHEVDPRIHTTSDALDLGEALERVEPRFAALLSVPIRTPRGLLGLALLYFGPDAAMPSAAVMGHLGTMCRALSSCLELHATLDTMRHAERVLDVAVQGTASVRGLGELVGFLESLREEFGAMRTQSDVAPELRSDLTRLAPGLLGALATARALLSFTQGALETEPVDVDSLFAELGVDNLQLTKTEPGLRVIGNRVLLRLALKALVEHACHEARGVSVPVRVSGEGGRLRIFLSETPPPVALLGAGAPSATPPGLALGFVRRVIELHGGRFEIESGGPGRRFAITLTPG